MDKSIKNVLSTVENRSDALETVLSGDYFQRENIRQLSKNRLEQNRVFVRFGFLRVLR